MTYGKNAFLFSGDAESEEEREMLERWGADAFAADVLKVGHHGSSSSSSKAFLDAVDPTYAVISCGKDNDYGHPHAETLAALKKKNIAILRTDTDGTVILESDGEKVTLVSQSR